MYPQTSVCVAQVVERLFVAQEVRIQVPTYTYFYMMLYFEECFYNMGGIMAKKAAAKLQEVVKEVKYVYPFATPPSITIALVDKKHVVVRGVTIKNRAENFHYHDEEIARKELDRMLKQYGKDGYSVEQMAKDTFKLVKEKQ